MVPKQSSQARAAVSVWARISPSWISALVRIWSVVRLGNRLYQNCVTICWRRTHRLKRPPSSAPPNTSRRVFGKPLPWLHTAVWPSCALVMKSSR